MQNESLLHQANNVRRTNVQRRKFVAASAGIALMFGLGIAGEAETKKALLRPPGGQDEASFFSQLY